VVHDDKRPEKRGRYRGSVFMPPSNGQLSDDPLLEDGEAQYGDVHDDDPEYDEAYDFETQEDELHDGETNNNEVQRRARPGDGFLRTQSIQLIRRIHAAFTPLFMVSVYGLCTLRPALQFTFGGQSRAADRWRVEETWLTLLAKRVSMLLS
jgi:hypothetical protein